MNHLTLHIFHYSTVEDMVALYSCSKKFRSTLETETCFLEACVIKIMLLITTGETQFTREDVLSNPKFSYFSIHWGEIWNIFTPFVNFKYLNGSFIYYVMVWFRSWGCYTTWAIKEEFALTVKPANFSIIFPQSCLYVKPPKKYFIDNLTVSQKRFAILSYPDTELYRKMKNSNAGQLFFDCNTHIHFADYEFGDYNGKGGDVKKYFSKLNQLTFEGFDSLFPIHHYQSVFTNF